MLILKPSHLNSLPWDSQEYAERISIDFHLELLFKQNWIDEPRENAL